MIEKSEEFKKLEKWLAEREKENHRILAELHVLRMENKSLVAAEENQREQLAVYLGEIGIDVSNCYDFSDLMRQLRETVDMPNRGK